MADELFVRMDVSFPAEDGAGLDPFAWTLLTRALWPMALRKRRELLAVKNASFWGGACRIPKEYIKKAFQDLELADLIELLPQGIHVKGQCQKHRKLKIKGISACLAEIHNIAPKYLDESQPNNEKEQKTNLDPVSPTYLNETNQNIEKGELIPFPEDSKTTLNFKPLTLNPKPKDLKALTEDKLPSIEREPAPGGNGKGKVSRLLFLKVSGNSIQEIYKIINDPTHKDACYPMQTTRDGPQVRALFDAIMTIPEWRDRQKQTLQFIWQARETGRHKIRTMIKLLTKPENPPPDSTQEKAGQVLREWSKIELTGPVGNRLAAARARKEKDNVPEH